MLMGYHPDKKREQLIRIIEKLPDFAAKNNGAERLGFYLKILSQACGNKTCRDGTKMIVLLNNWLTNLVEDIKIANPDAVSVVEKRLDVIRKGIEKSGDETAKYMMATRPVKTGVVGGLLPNGKLFM